MSDFSNSNPLAGLSATLSSLVAATASSIVAVHSGRAHSSGFVWKPSLIVTADEALAEEGDITVTLPDGTRMAATVAGRDATTDIALLRIDGIAGTPLMLADAEPPQTGTLAITVGARDGQPVAAFGMVAASGAAWRSMRGGQIDARLELDLSLRRHSEGGVALGVAGQVFGMTVFGPRRRVLVIPSATIARVATQLEARGKIPRGYLGLGLRRVRLDGRDGVGAMVMSVDPHGPGARAGVHQGDVIDQWNGQSLGMHALLGALGPASVGQTVALGVRRGGESRAVDLVVGERPDA